MFSMKPERFHKLKRALDRRQPDLTVFADSVHKPHNVSAILRTCDAVGIGRLHAVAADGKLRRHHVMAGGSKRWVEVIVHRTSRAALEHLSEDGWTLTVAGAWEDAVDYRDIDYSRKIAIVVGAELEGPSAASLRAAELMIKIPMLGLVDSLNVSVATAVILYEAQRQREAAGMYDVSRMREPEYSRTLFEWAYPEIAERCTRRGLPYPPLTAAGELAVNPFAAARTQARPRSR
jgi:tRNA (guanosine-2'-O-)-methyltransferase